MPRVYRVSPTDCANAPVVIDLPKKYAGLLVHSGARGMRIDFDSKTKTQDSVRAATGLCLARTFEKLIFSAEFEPGTDAALLDVVVEVLDCPPITVASLGRGLVQYLHNADTVELANATETLVDETSAQLPEENDRRTHACDPWYIGGAIKCDAACELRLWAWITPGGERALVARLEIDQADTDGAFSASLETGWKRTHHAFGSNTQIHIHGPLLPVLMPWRLEIFLPGGAGATYSACIYARTI